MQLSTAVRSTKKKRYRRSLLTMNMELNNEVSAYICEGYIGMVSHCETGEEEDRL